MQLFVCQACCIPAPPSSDVDSADSEFLLCLLKEAHSKIDILQQEMATLKKHMSESGSTAESQMVKVEKELKAVRQQMSALQQIMTEANTAHAHALQVYDPAASCHALGECWTEKLELTPCMLFMPVIISCITFDDLLNIVSRFKFIQPSAATSVFERYSCHVVFCCTRSLSADVCT